MTDLNDRNVRLPDGLTEKPSTASEAPAASDQVVKKPIRRPGQGHGADGNLHDPRTGEPHVVRDENGMTLDERMAYLRMQDNQKSQAAIVRTTTLPFDDATQPSTKTSDDGTVSIEWPTASSATYELGKLLTGSMADATYIKPGAPVSLYGESSDHRGNNPNFGYMYDTSEPGTILWSGEGLKYSVSVGISLQDAHTLESLMQRVNADGQPAWLMESTPDGMFLGGILNMRPQDFAEHRLNASVTDTQVESALKSWKKLIQQNVDPQSPDKFPSVEAAIESFGGEEVVRESLRAELEQQPYKENILKRGLQTAYWAHWLEKHEGKEPQRADFPELNDRQFTQLKDNFDELNMPVRRSEEGLTKREEGKFTRRAYGLTYDFDIENGLNIDKVEFSQHAAALSAVYLHHMMDGSPDNVFALPIDQMAGAARFTDYETNLFHGKEGITLQVPRHRDGIEIGGIEKLSSLDDPGFNHVTLHVNENHLQAIFIRPDGPNADTIELQRQALLTQSAIYDITNGKVSIPIKLMSEDGRITDFTPTIEQISTALQNDSPELKAHVKDRFQTISKQETPSPDSQGQGSLDTVRQAAIERIEFFQDELAKRGIGVRMGAELEFFPLNEKGEPEARLLDEKALTEQLRKTARGIERVHNESFSQSQYEFVTGPNPDMPDTGIKDASPLATAEHVAAFKEGMAEQAPNWGIEGVSFDARQQVGKGKENSGLHVALSLWDTNGNQNLFYEQGQNTTDLQRHVIDALIRTHAEATAAYLPHGESYDRINASQSKSMQGMLDALNGAPNTAGHLPNKGLDVGYLTDAAKNAVLTGDAPIYTVASRYRTIPGAVMGLGEDVIGKMMDFQNERSSLIGWEKPHQYRLESRLAGADADPYMVVAMEMAAVYEAVTEHTREYDPSKPIDPAKETLVTVSDRQMVVDKHDGKFDSATIPKDIDSARTTMAQSERMRALLGDKLFNEVVAYTDPVNHPERSIESQTLSSDLVSQIKQAIDAPAQKGRVSEQEATQSATLSEESATAAPTGEQESSISAEEASQSSNGDPSEPTVSKDSTAGQDADSNNTGVEDKILEAVALAATQHDADGHERTDVTQRVKLAMDTGESPIRHPEARGRSTWLTGTPEHRPNTVDFKMKGVGAAGLANRMNAIKEGKMGLDEAAAQGTAILADTIDVASDMRLGDKLRAFSGAGANTKAGQLMSKLNISSKMGNRMGWVGNALGIVADSYSGYKKGGIVEARYQGTKSTLNTGVSLAVFLDQGKNLAGKGPAVGGVAGFAGKMGLINSFSTAAGDAMDYASGRKELNMDTYGETALNTVVNLDPLKAVTSLAGATKLVGVDTGLQHVSISSIVDKGLGTVGLTDGKGEQIGDVVAETMSIYEKEKQRFKAGELDPSLRRNGSSPIPAMTDYKHLGAIRHQLAKYLPGGKIDGHRVSGEFDEIDMTDASNYMAYKNALNKAILEQSRIMEKHSSYVPRWVRFGDSAHKYNAAESQRNLYLAAEKEFGMFENKIIAWRRQQEQLAAQQKQYESSFKAAINSLDTNKDGNIGVDELNLAKNRASANTLDQEDLAALRTQLGSYGKDVAANLEQALLDSGVKFDGSMAINSAPNNTPKMEQSDNKLAGK